MRTVHKIALGLFGGQGAAPANTVAPSFTGTDEVGELQTGDEGTWVPAAAGYTYQWYRDDVAIAGATDSTYTTVAADAGTTLTFGVTPTNAGASEAVSAGTPIYWAAPTLTAPSADAIISTATPTVTWDAIVGVDDYYIQISDSSTVDGSGAFTTALVDEIVLGAESYVPPDLSTLGYLYIHVRAVDGKWCVARRFYLSPEIISSYALGMVAGFKTYSDAGETTPVVNGAVALRWRSIEAASPDLLSGSNSPVYVANDAVLNAPAISFVKNSSQRMTFTAIDATNTDYDIWIKFTMPAIVTRNSLLGGALPTLYTIESNGAPRVGFGATNGTGDVTFSGKLLQVNTPYVLRFYRTGTALNCAVYDSGGKTVLTPDKAIHADDVGLAFTMIGRNNTSIYSDQNISEIHIWKKQLSVGEAAQLETYFSSLLAYDGSSGWYAEQGASGVGTLADPADLAYLRQVAAHGATINLLASGGAFQIPATSFTLYQVLQPYDTNTVTLELGTDGGGNIALIENHSKTLTIAPTGRLTSGNGLLIVRSNPDYRHTTPRLHYPPFWNISFSTYDRTVPALDCIIVTDYGTINSAGGIGYAHNGCVFVNGGYRYDDDSSDGGGVPGVGAGEIAYFHNSNSEAADTKVTKAVVANDAANWAQIYSASGIDAYNYELQDIEICGLVNPSVDGSDLSGVLYALNPGSIVNFNLRRLRQFYGGLSIGNQFEANTGLLIEDSTIVSDKNNFGHLWNGFSLVDNRWVAAADLTNIINWDNLTGTVTVEGNDYFSPTSDTLALGAGQRTFAQHQSDGHDLTGSYTAALPATNDVEVLSFGGTGRLKGKVSIHNWEESSSVNVDMTAMGLTDGVDYEAWSVQNLFDEAPTGVSNVQAFTYNAAAPTVAFDFTDMTVSVPRGESIAYGLISPKYGCWIIVDVSV